MEDNKVELLEFSEIPWEDTGIEFNVIQEQDGIKYIPITKYIINPNPDVNNPKFGGTIIVGCYKVPFMFEYHLAEMMEYAAKVSKEYTQKEIRIALGMMGTSPLDAATNHFKDTYYKLKEQRRDLNNAKQP